MYCTARPLRLLRRHKVERLWSVLRWVLWVLLGSGRLETGIWLCLLLVAVAACLWWRCAVRLLLWWVAAVGRPAVVLLWWMGH